MRRQRPHDDDTEAIRVLLHAASVERLERHLQRRPPQDAAAACDLLCTATRLGFYEAVALLRRMGADARAPSPAHGGLSAHDLAGAHMHARDRPRYGYLMCLLEDGVPDAAPPPRLYHDRVGLDANAPLDGVGPEGLGDDAEQLARRETPAMFAVQHGFAHGLAWLVERRGARLDAVDADGLSPVGHAMAALEGAPSHVEHARALFVLADLLVRRYGQDPVPYAAAFPAAMRALAEDAALRLRRSGFFPCLPETPTGRSAGGRAFF